MADISTSPMITLKKMNISHENLEIQTAANYEYRASDIAIVGVGFDFPNGSNLAQFWQGLLDNKSFARETPLDRYTREQTAPMSKNVPNHGNFLANPWEFDNALFGISPREAMAMDPQQRLLLQCSYHALEHAGYVPDSTQSTRRETFGCFVGVATGDYASRASEDLDVYHSTGTLRAFLSGRLSYFFGMSGPSVVVDTACSGSLVAIHQACRALAAGECKSALAGGVNVICGPEMQSGLARSHFLSPESQCRPFDASADGYCRGEGCGIVVLKLLSDALADNDRILGVIKGTGVNQSGNAHSITHPHKESQVQLINRVLKQSMVFPHTVGAAEAHGTGTKAGDPVEFSSLTSIFGTTATRTNPFIISSLKGNIGHTEAASGAAGLIKLLMMVTTGEIPRQAGLDMVNPKIVAMMHEGIQIPQSTTPWPRVAGRPRRAVLNNFGASGSNACLILEEHLQPKPSDEPPSRSSHVFFLSAKDQAAFARQRAAVIKQLEEYDEATRDICYTSIRRELHQTRLVVAVESRKQLLEVLRDPNIQPEDIHQGPPKPGTFLSTGS
ncbi:unnamed protein product [Clonostachys rosea]|uniref:Ketosynthase family 3 (KS3) domain-containing protein n=1 Tax=Bionectria ochroleuca TaxID=29856 RepID=A0ABY6UMP3_BIOOC|nr:unnamed protein product [Clonostachys rosea]